MNTRRVLWIGAIGLVFLVAGVLYARGFGGGGGGGARGGGGGGGFQRGGGGGAPRSGGYQGGTPRPSNRDSGGYRGEAGFSNRQVALPTDAGFGRAAARPGVDNRPAGGVVGIDNRPGARPGVDNRMAARPAINNRTAALPAGVAAARGAAVRNNFGRFDTFDRNWWNNHPGGWRPPNWNPNWDHNWWWRRPTWISIGGWWGWPSATTPIYYDYGSNVTYQGDQVYYGAEPVATAGEYYDQAQSLAQSTPATQPANDEWMPLGVFSLVQGDQSDSDVVFQLSVSKAGQIAGNYTSLLTGTTLPVRGAVDKKTQRAAWTVGDNKTTVYDTAISNLTKDESPLLLHYDKGRTQQWMLVRQKQPEQAGG